MSRKTLYGLLLTCLAAIPSLLPGQDRMQFKNAGFTFTGDILRVSTGRVERTWEWTGKGFHTTGFRDMVSGREWATAGPEYGSDWDLPTKIGEGSSAELVSVVCVESDDEGFTSPHLLVTATMRYESGLELQYLIRAYPGAPGIWTALNVRALPVYFPEGIPEDVSTEKYYGSDQPVKIARCEYIPFDFSRKNRRRYWGFYNDPGNRHNTREMVKEELVEGYPIFWDEQNLWASGLVVETPGHGLILLKESNKTVNNYGHQTGAFYCTPGGIEVTGWGLKPMEITREFRRTWATWSILYTGGEDEMELALKVFDRMRFPIDIKRDMHMLVDTWGTDFREGEYDKLYGRENSHFTVVEKEIKSAADLGIEIVRIDDGWQAGANSRISTWRPDTAAGYSADWSKVKALSDKYGVGIGLWASIRRIDIEEMLWNQRKLNVATWKLDYERIVDWQTFHGRMQGMREFILSCDHETQVSWCPEYTSQRYGWYSEAREYGPMYFQNIMNNLPRHIIYVPYITLKHHWMMSKYYNMNKLQCSWQNPSLTNPGFSDAIRHSHSYAAMASLVGVPSFFMLTQFLEPGERDEIRKLINVYKDQRPEIFESYVFPIGAKPDNQSWTGFQICHPERGSGYLMVFRELHNHRKNHTIRLRFLKDTNIRIINLENPGQETTVRVNAEGGIPLTIEDPAAYLFLKYVEDAETL